jgi:SpoVK/Ycf46/Vps4 family AAA+-type ATPase
LDELVKWLSPLHYNVKHEESVEKHQQDTGTWLFEKEIYQKWEQSTRSGLWIHGIPGCGKTILA